MRTYSVTYEYIEYNENAPYIPMKYVTADSITLALQKALTNVKENQRVSGIREEGEAIV